MNGRASNIRFMDLGPELWAHIASFDFYVASRLFLAIPGLYNYLKHHNLYDSFMSRFLIHVQDGRDFYKFPNECRHGPFRDDSHTKEYRYGRLHGVQEYISGERYGWENDRLMWHQSGDCVCFADCILVNMAYKGQVCRWRRFWPGEHCVVKGCGYVVGGSGRFVRLVKPRPFTYDGEARFQIHWGKIRGARMVCITVYLDKCTITPCGIIVHHELFDATFEPGYAIFDFRHLGRFIFIVKSVSRRAKGITIYGENGDRFRYENGNFSLRRKYNVWEWIRYRDGELYMIGPVTRIYNDRGYCSYGYPKPFRLPRGDKPLPEFIRDVYHKLRRGY